MWSRHSSQRRATARQRGSAKRWGAFVIGALAIGACTLTQSEYEPPLIEAETLAPDAGGGAPACASGDECCAALPCSGGAACLDGRCATSPVPPAPDAGECTGSDCSRPPVPLAPSCDDDVVNGDETDTDCGGSCASRCTVNAACESDADCEPGLFCPSATSRCTSAACNDQVKNGAELLADCGGGECPGCPDGSACNTGSDCESGVCGAQGTCSPPTCDDDVRNQDETAADCGGSCAQGCDTGDACVVGADCASQRCAPVFCPPGVAPCCQPPSCNDGARNGTESGVDCGNFACGPCPLGEGCSVNAQCSSGFCQQGQCADPGTCGDGVQNGDESSADCGGTRCGVCPDLRTCNQDSDCFNNNCDERGICISCGDNTLNGTETGVDCGGADPFCRRCNPGERCLINSDCTTGVCFNGFC